MATNDHLRSSLLLAAIVSAIHIGCRSETPVGPVSPGKPTDEISTPQSTKNAQESLVPAEPESPIRFTSMLEASGIRFVHTSGNSPEKPFPAANGSGVATFDYDLDGQYDLYFANGAMFPIDQSRRSQTDRFWRNLKNWSFADVTAVSGLRTAGYSAGLATADFNSDGFPDLYITSVGAAQLYCNLGDGTFEEVSAESRTDDARWGTSAAFLDFDNDGYLDLYVCHYGQWSFENNQFCGDPVRRIRMFCSPTLMPPEKGVLFRNQGDGTFEDVSESTGIAVRTGRGQGVLAADLNSDSHTDLYVANDINPNFLFLNDGQGHFTEHAEASGTAYDHLGKTHAGMGLALADIDRNGHFDLLVTNYQNEHNSLYENLGNNIFMETGTTRVPQGSLPYVGWGTAFADFDLDGWPDLIVTNGHTDDNLADLGKEGVYLQPCGLWRNQEGRFTLLSNAAGAYFKEPHCGRGLVTADLDNDGDPDAAIGHQDNQPALLRNDRNSSGPGDYLQLTLIGRQCNRDAVGAVVEIVSVRPPQLQAVFGGGSYESASDKRLIFGLQQQATELSLAIRWPGGTESTAVGLKAGIAYTILEPVAPDTAARFFRVCDN